MKLQLDSVLFQEAGDNIQAPKSSQKVSQC